MRNLGPAPRNWDYAEYYDAAENYAVATTKKRLAFGRMDIASVSIDNTGAQTCYLSFNKENEKAFPVLSGASFSVNIHAASMWIWTSTATTTINYFVTLVPKPND